MSVGDTLWAWQVQEADGRWSMVGTMIPAVGTHMPLVHRDRETVMRMAAYAKLHAERTGQPLRLAEFRLQNQWTEN